MIPLDNSASLKRHLGQPPNDKVLYEKGSELGWCVGKRARGYRQIGPAWEKPRSRNEGRNAFQE